jgi:hypothetical protein
MNLFALHQLRKSAGFTFCDDRLYGRARRADEVVVRESQLTKSFHQAGAGTERRSAFAKAMRTASARQRRLVSRVGIEHVGEPEGRSHLPTEEAGETTRTNVRVVSRLGIEPRTRRLRVCCSAN